MTYMMAASAGLTIAMALALPSLLSMPKAAPAAAAAPPDAAAISTMPTVADGMSKTPRPADNQTLLASNVASGMLTATVNGRTIGEMQSTMQIDISTYVHPGENTIRLFWLGTTDANLKITYSASAGQPRDVISAFVSPAESTAPGERSVTFFL
jgi:hypothetical protein